MRIIQWQLFINTSATQTKKIKLVLTLADRMRVKEYPGNNPHGVSTKFRSPCLSQHLLMYRSEVYDTEMRTRTKHQEIQIQLTHLITPWLAAPQATYFSLFRVKCKQLFSWLCVVATTPKTGREARQGNRMQHQYKSFSNRVKERSYSQCFKHIAVYFKVKH